MKLSKRMEMLVNLVPRDTVLCDVGCDHGYVSIELIRKEICPRVYTMDLREGPLQRAREHIEEAGLQERITTVLSDGIKDLPADASPDVLLAAGMGGALIQDILEEGKDRIRKMSYLLLQPQSEIPEVREYLRENGYEILSEDMVLEDGKYYFAMLAKVGGGLSVHYQHLTDCFCDLWKETDPARKNVTLIPDQIRNTLSGMALDLGDLFGPALLADVHDLMPEYLQAVSAEKRKVLETLSSSMDHQERKMEIADDLEAIRLAGQILSLAARKHLSEDRFAG